MRKTLAALIAGIMAAALIAAAATTTSASSGRPVVTQDAARAAMIARWPDVDPNSSKAKCYVACTSGDGALGCRFCVSACGLPRKMSKTCPD